MTRCPGVDEHDHGLGVVAGAFQGAEPRQSERQAATVEKSPQTVLTQRGIDVCRTSA